MEDQSPEDKKLSELFDLSGDKKVVSYVQRFEELFRSREVINADIKQLAADASEDMLSKKEIEAIKKVAKWRLDDKLGAAQEMLGALKRVSKAVAANLFQWADSQN